MRNMVYLGLLALIVAPAAAQDMPLSQILIDGEGWKLAFTDKIALPSALTVDDKGQLHEGKKDGTIYLMKHNLVLLAVARNLLGIQRLGFGRDGLLYVVQPEQRRIGVWERRDLRVIAKDIVADDLVATRRGSVYCIVPAEKAIYLVGPNGTTRAIDKLPFQPTGMTLWPDDGTLVISASEARHLWAYRIDKDGGLSCKDRYYTLRVPAGQAASGAFGMTVDTVGRLYVATRVGVQVFDPTGRLSGVLLNPTTEPPSTVMFGGPDHDTLYAVCGNQVYMRKVKAKGVLPPAAPVP